MTDRVRPIQIGEPLPALSVRAASGDEVDLRTWRGRPLLLVCIRYYG
jgi:peroxiredoxin